jgi:hypothetical protein
MNIRSFHGVCDPIPTFWFSYTEGFTVMTLHKYEKYEKQQRDVVHGRPTCALNHNGKQSDLLNSDPTVHTALLYLPLGSSLVGNSRHLQNNTDNVFCTSYGSVEDHTTVLLVDVDDEQMHSHKHYVTRSTAPPCSVRSCMRKRFGTIKVNRSVSTLDTTTLTPMECS